MTKYYVTCGNQQLVLAAMSAEDAANRMIDNALSIHVWIYEDSNLTEAMRRDHLVLEALLTLAPTVMVSERGFGRSEAGLFELPEMIQQWHKLMTVLSQMFA